MCFSRHQVRKLFFLLGGGKFMYVYLLRITVVMIPYSNTVHSKEILTWDHPGAMDRLPEIENDRSRPSVGVDRTTAT